MITIDTLRIYEEFDGDSDGWSRSGRCNNSSGFTDQDWFLIDELRQALFIIASGSASPEFRVSTEKKLILSTADEQTREALRRLASVS